MSEDQLQSKCFQDHWNRYPEKRRRLFHINQKARNAIEGNRFKAMGVVPGVSDFAYLIPGSVRWIEMKIPCGVQSAEQIAFQATVEELGMEYHLCYTIERFRELTAD